MLISYQIVKISVLKQNHLYAVIGERRKREEEDKLLEETVLDIVRSGQQKPVTFSWGRCVMETCLIGKLVTNITKYMSDTVIMASIVPLAMLCVETMWQEMSVEFVIYYICM